jgi:hypothetical protein
MVIEEEAKPTPPPEPIRDPEPWQVALDANNRFSALFAEWDQGDDPTLHWHPDAVRYSENAEVPIEIRRGLQVEATNLARAKLGQALKPVDTPKLDGWRMAAQRASFLATLKDKVVKPLFSWRENHLAQYIRTGQPGRLTPAPIILLEAYERWATTVLRSGVAVPPRLHLSNVGLGGPTMSWEYDPRMARTDLKIYLRPREKSPVTPGLPGG